MTAGTKGREGGRVGLEVSMGRGRFLDLGEAEISHVTFEFSPIRP